MIKAEAWWYGSRTLKNVTYFPSQNLRIGRALFGSQTHNAKPSNANNRLSVTTNLVVSEVPCNRRMMMISSSTPNAGARTRRQTARAMGAGQCQPKRISQ